MGGGSPSMPEDKSLVPRTAFWLQGTQNGLTLFDFEAFATLSGYIDLIQEVLKILMFDSQCPRTISASTEGVFAGQKSCKDLFHIPPGHIGYFNDGRIQGRLKGRL